jgi:hypothetical protein
MLIPKLISKPECRLYSECAKQLVTHRVKNTSKSHIKVRNYNDMAFVFIKYALTSFSTLNITTEISHHFVYLPFVKKQRFKKHQIFLSTN